MKTFSAAAVLQLTSMTAANAFSVRLPSGAMCIDCVTAHPSHKHPSVTEMMRDVDAKQEDARNAYAERITAQTNAKRALENDAAHAQADMARAKAMQTEAQGEANRANAAAGYLDRGNRPRPFQSGF